MDIFSKHKQEQIAQAIGEAEAHTSGEIRVCIEQYCPGDVMERARESFYNLGMHKTNLHNGVLIYMSMNDHKFAIIGDKGIHEQVGSNFWEDTKQKMLVHFKEDHLTNGILAGIACVGEKLQVLFPSQEDNKNELPNEIVFLDKQKKD
ncbi:TPM domain-containing protein [Olivibacter sitiensis]|uniref:TPM domain-containing protein n=1 Tax=Olivibacter sitiensis TaxID=376470 RepID=UPI000401CB57|nr:TPM domain-containing protein [Olivibacter sitiensis]